MWKICSISLILASDLTDYLIFLEERKKKKERGERERGGREKKEGGRNEERREGKKIMRTKRKGKLKIGTS